MAEGDVALANQAAREQWCAALRVGYGSRRSLPDAATREASEGQCDGFQPSRSGSRATQDKEVEADAEHFCDARLFVAAGHGCDLWSSRPFCGELSQREILSALLQS